MAAGWLGQSSKKRRQASGGTRPKLTFRLSIALKTSDGRSHGHNTCAQKWDVIKICPKQVIPCMNVIMCMGSLFLKPPEAQQSCDGSPAVCTIDEGGCAHHARRCACACFASRIAGQSVSAKHVLQANKAGAHLMRIRPIRCQQPTTNSGSSAMSRRH